MTTTEKDVKNYESFSDFLHKNLKASDYEKLPEILGLSQNLLTRLETGTNKWQSLLVFTMLQYMTDNGYSFNYVNVLEFVIATGIADVITVSELKQIERIINPLNIK